MKISQADIYLAELNPVKGHEQAGYRPVLVIQNNILNKNLNTAVIVPITTNLKAKGLLTTFFLPAETSTLPKDSVALLFQIRTLDKKRLKKKISNLGPQVFLKLKEQLKFIF